MVRRLTLLILASFFCGQVLAVNVVGTPTAIVWGTGANPAAQNMNVNAAATMCALYWVWFGSTNGAGVLTLTLGGNAGTVTEIAMDTGVGEPAAGVAVWFSPTTGASVALDPQWDSAIDDGPTSIFVCFDDSLTTALRDSEAVQSTGTNALSITLTGLTAGDMVVKFDGRFDAALPALSAGWTNVQTQTNNNSYSGRVASIVATGASQVCTGEDESFSGLVCIGIPDAGGGAASGLLRRRRGN